VWAQILADIFGVPVARVLEPNPGIRGAAAYGWAALDTSQSVIDLARAHPTPLEAFEPTAEHRAPYEEAAGIYAALRTALHESGLDGRIAAAGASSAEAG
jgi:sugar (pentulose or hexulose) kinase